MSETMLAQALSSDVSWKILDLLVIGDSEETEIARSIGVRHSLMERQLRKLVRAGVVSERNEILASGNVMRIYHLTREQRSVGFPPRKYEFLSEALIERLVSSLGEDGAKVVLRDIGLRIGEDSGEILVSRTHREKWSPSEFAEAFVKRFLSEMKTYPRLVSVGRKRVVYEQLNCPFQELADKFPGLVCDVLDESVHEGIDGKLRVKSTRLACRGHGDPVCKYSVAWPKDVRNRGVGSRKAS